MAAFAAGLHCQQSGRMTDALGFYTEAARLRPDVPETQYNLGIALAALGRLEEAAGAYRAAIALKPAFAQAHNNLGHVLDSLGRAQEAGDCYQRACDLDPGYADAHANLGKSLKDRGRLEEAAACYDHARRLRPDDPTAHNNLGAALVALHRVEEAAACFIEAIRLRSDYAEAHNNLGNVRAKERRAEDAIACYHRALHLQPHYPEALYNLGNAMMDQGHLDAAIACYDRALVLKPDYLAAHNNLGNALKDNDRPEEAIACYARALALQPDVAEAHNNLGNALKELGRLDEAVGCYHNAIARKPELAEAHNNLAMALLAQGDLPSGWRAYEWRWQTPHLRPSCRRFAQPQWRGEAAAGQCLLIHAEQGFGDTLQFCRYATLAQARGLRVILQVPRTLVRLLGSVAGVERVIAEGEAPPAFDLHCPMLSLPLALGTTLATIPAGIPYLHGEPAQVAHWQARLAQMGQAGAGQASLRVGLVWAGNPRLHTPALAAIDRRRSIAVDQLAPLWAVPGVRFISLQKEGPSLPAGYPIADHMAGMADFADTAALVANLDLVIAVDTAVAHLAGALGKPVWLMDRFSPCWRWLTGRRDSPWYPSLRLYRQHKAGDWAPVIAAIAADLHACATAGGAGSVDADRLAPGGVGVIAVAAGGDDCRPQPQLSLTGE